MVEGQKSYSAILIIRKPKIGTLFSHWLKLPLLFMICCKPPYLSPDRL